MNHIREQVLMHLSNHSPSKCTIAHNPELLTLFSGMETMNNLTLDTRQLTQIVSLFAARFSFLFAEGV